MGADARASAGDPRPRAPRQGQARHERRVHRGAARQGEVLHMRDGEKHGARMGRGVHIRAAAWRAGGRGPRRTPGRHRRPHLHRHAPRAHRP